MSEPFLKITYNYDNYSQLTGIDVNGQPEITYELNKDNQRIAAAPANAGAWQYQYDNLGQLTGAIRKDSDTELNNMSYRYDMIGNRLESSEDSDEKEYVTNLLNQYTQLSTVNCQLSTSATPTYDRNGNMLTNRGWTYTWNTENRLIKAEKGDLRLEFDYDYKGRRAFKKVYESNILIKHQKFAYHNFKLVAIYDALNNNARTHAFLWQPESVGLDMPLSMTLGDDTYFYVADGNKNVTGIFDETGTRIITYTYGPFGQVLSMVGPLAEANPFRFSSEFHDDETGLVYYNYRYYDSTIGRWTKRDPLREKGAKNLYNFVRNNSSCFFDRLGMISISDALKKEFDSFGIPWMYNLGNMEYYGWYDNLSDKDVFDIWAKWDEAEGTDWLTKIPECPSKICINKVTNKPANCTNGQWSSIGKANQTYHPKAAWAMRTNYLLSISNGPQQQCTYDASGNLIKSGLGAGTPDKATGSALGYIYYLHGLVNGIKINNHIQQDVRPFELAQKIDGKDNLGEATDKYLKLRPPSQGGGYCYSLPSPSRLPSRNFDWSNVIWR